MLPGRAVRSLRYRCLRVLRSDDVQSRDDTLARSDLQSVASSPRCTGGLIAA